MRCHHVSRYAPPLEPKLPLPLRGSEWAPCTGAVVPYLLLRALTVQGHVVVETLSLNHQLYAICAAL